MKKYILLLLLATFGMQAQTYQNPTYGNVKLKNNQTSTTATKVNVQESDGTINTKPLSELDNYLEFASAVNLPVTGEQGKLYLTKDNNRLYRFNGTIYQELTTALTVANALSNYLPLSGGTLSGILRFAGSGGIITPNTLISEINNYAGGENQFKSSSIKFYTGSYVDRGKITFNTSIDGIDHVRLTLEETGEATFSSTVTASPATLPNHVVVKSQLDAAVGNSTSGGFSATVTNMVNVADFFINSATYTKIGNIVNAYASISISPSASGKSTFNLPLPIARQQTSSLAIGSGSGSTYNNIIPIYISSNSTTTALVTLYSPPPTNISINIHFQYDITK